MMEGKRIQRLEKAVVNRIAAGEVIQRPANAIKEMIENSLDAGSTGIQVVVKSGGLKMLQVQDNGHGIEKDDLHIVCERFTTSKLEKFEDLSNLNTYGFRGEALASISHVAHVTITTRTASSKCAFRAAYSDGVMVPLRPGAAAEPKPCAGNQGTLITVEDLFYNVHTRRKALKSPSEELARITDIMTKYAIHNSGKGFSLKKHASTVTEIKTCAEHSIQENIGLLYGPSVQKELISVAVENERIGFSMKGYVTNANYSMKKCQCLLFINHRLVDSSSLRKALEVVYVSILPKNCHPFIYMSILINPENIDVNVHPTKHEVHFLHEDLIIDSVQKVVEEKILSFNSSRTYYTQSLLLPSTSATVSVYSEKKDTDDAKVYDYKLVRTDTKEKKLDAFILPQEVSESNDNVSIFEPKARKPIHLTSVLSLQNEVKKNKHNELSNFFSNHKFVGFVDQSRALVQYDTGLFLMDLSQVSKELFFQLVLFDFNNFGSLRLTTPAPIYEMVLVAIESPSSGWSSEDGPKEKLAQKMASCEPLSWQEQEENQFYWYACVETGAPYVVDFLATKAKMLQEYFSLEIKDGCIYTLPALLDNYSPNLDRLPQFLLCLAVEVNWDNEKACFLTFAQECASFYSIQYDPFLPDSKKRASTVSGADTTLYKDSSWEWVSEHVVLPALRLKMIPPCSLAQNGSILQIADLHELYKVFERC